MTPRELATWAASIPDVHFLDDQAVEIDDVTFLGSTLWSNFDHAHAGLMKKSTSMMADYAVIADRTDPASVCALSAFSTNTSTASLSSSANCAPAIRHARSSSPTTPRACTRRAPKAKTGSTSTAPTTTH